jgi:hypothetical protein
MTTCRRRLHSPCRYAWTAQTKRVISGSWCNSYLRRCCALSMHMRAMELPTAVLLLGCNWLQPTCCTQASPYLTQYHPPQCHSVNSFACCPFCWSAGCD